MDFQTITTKLTGPEKKRVAVRPGRKSSFALFILTGVESQRVASELDLVRREYLKLTIN